MRGFFHGAIQKYHTLMVAYSEQLGFAVANGISAGATIILLAFVALAATMYFTRNEDWYGPEGKGMFVKKAKASPESIEAKAGRTVAAKAAEAQSYACSTRTIE
ncbi:hypothetical protein [Pacificibacter sp. AS14]|uniref:hypothetical protein n=1 Tax=Pacificibacter sp. AS14 TaxID=3135785 RepID=UPI00316CA556